MEDEEHARIPRNFPKRPNQMQMQNFGHRPNAEVDDFLQEFGSNSGKLNIDNRRYVIQGNDVYKEGQGDNAKEFDGIQCHQVDKLQNPEKLGNGASGTVVKYKIDGHFVAEKEVRLCPDNLRYVRELRITQQCGECPQIVTYYGYAINAERLAIYIELMDTSGRELLNKAIQQNPHSNIVFPEKIISKIASEVVKALKYLKNNHRLIHRDIYPNNILFDLKGNIKICDFGISTELNTLSLAKTFNRGCLHYLAPERLKEVGEDNKPYGAPADVWSLAISLMEFARGKNPYLTDSTMTSFEQMVHMIQSEPPRLQQNDGFSLEFCQYIEKCLQQDPTNRPRFEEILQDPFVQQAEQVSNDVVARWVSEQLNL